MPCFHTTLVCYLWFMDRHCVSWLLVWSLASLVLGAGG